MFAFLFAVIGIIASIAFYMLVVQACRALIVMACSSDHGHGEANAFNCKCRCHLQHGAPTRVK